MGLEEWERPCPDPPPPYPPSFIFPFAAETSDCRVFGSRDVEGELQQEVQHRDMEFLAPLPPSEPPYSCTAGFLSSPGFNITNFTYKLLPTDDLREGPDPRPNFATLYAELDVVGTQASPREIRWGDQFLGPDQELNVPGTWHPSYSGDEYQWAPWNRSLTLRTIVFSCDEKELGRR